MTMPHHVPNPDRPAGMSVRHWQMYKRFPQGSYARVKEGHLEGQLVQICEAVDDSTSRFRVRLNPLGETQGGSTNLYMRTLVPLSELEVIAEASK